MNTDPGTNTNPNLGRPLDIAEFSDMIEFANASAALEFLLTVKSGIRITAMSLTECATSDVRNLVKQQLFQGLDMHEKLTKLMMQKGWLHPFNLDEQFQLDAKSAQRTGDIAKMPLFKDRIKVLEAFDTPVNPN